MDRTLPTPLRALRHRNFRRFYVAQTVSIVGTWVQTIALAWLMYRLTGSALLLGVTTFLTQAPILLVGPLSGWLSDRFDRRRLLVVAQSLLLLQALALGVLTLSGIATPTVLLALALLQGLIAATDTPVRQAFLSVMVPDKADLPNAIALNSFLMNSGRLVGPSVAGLLLAVVPEGVCFLLNAATYLAVVVAVATMRVDHAPARRHAGSVLGDIRAGLRYAWQWPPARRLLPLVVVVSFFASPYSTLMPVVAKTVFDGSPRTLGFLVGTAGLGGVCGTAFLATRRRIDRLPWMSAGALALAGASLVGFAFSTWYPLSLLLMFGTGFGIITTAASVNMVLQTTVADEMRGRIISLYTMSFLGIAPFGALWAGFLSEGAGPLVAIGSGGTICLLAALAATRRARTAAPSRPRTQDQPIQ
jgi:MFS family permease